MAALFQCFGKKRMNKNHNCDDNDDEPVKNGNGCKCNKVNELLQCPNCKSTLHGYWSANCNNKDGGVCGKIVCEDRNSRSSAEHESTSDGHSPTTASPPQRPNYVSDYRPMAQGNISGMSYMPVSKDNPNYNMDHPRRGKAVIFNFDRWENSNIPSLDLSPRLGSTKDKRDLDTCLKKLNFEVKTYDNLRRQDYDGVIDKVRLEDHTDADCLLIAVMTHGERNSIYLSCGSLIPVNSLWEEFEANKCPSLAGKPKIFIIQACRGDRYDHGTQLRNGRGVGPFPYDVIDSVSFSYVIPNAADIIVAFSCPLGHYSWRHPERGSWFIQSICDVFSRSGVQNQELKSLLTTVAREVAVNYISSTNQIESDRKKQVPSTSSTLIRNVYFTPKSSKLVIAQKGNEETVKSSTKTAHQRNESAHLIRLEDVQIGLAQAQSSVAENELPEILNYARRPDALPLMTVTESVINLEPVIAFEVEKPVLTQENGVLSEDLTPEELPATTPLEKSSRLPK